MWSFRRKLENLDNVPTEVQQYYQAEQRERMGVAWLLAFVTLVVTVAVVLGLFFGGRAVYRKVADKDKPQTTTQQETAETPATPNPKAEDSPSSAGSSSNESSATNSTAPAGSDSSKAGSSSSATSTQTSTSTNTGPNTIANTGPGGTLAAFVVASVLGFGFYELHLYRKLN